MVRAMTKLKQQNAIPAGISNLWKEGEDLKELPKSVGFYFIPEIPTRPYMMIIASKSTQNLMTIRIPVPAQFIATLRTTDSLLPPPKTQSFNRLGGHSIRHYTLWATYSNHAYKS